MEHFNLFTITMVLILAYADGTANGPPVGPAYPNLCTDMVPSGHGAAPQTVATPMTITTSETCYKSGQEIEGLYFSSSQCYTYLKKD